MNLKAISTRYIYFLAVAMLVCNIYIPLHYRTPYPKPLGPQFTKKIKDERIREIEVSRPNFVLIGDSTLEEGVDQSLLTQTLGEETYKMSVPGSATAAWYLVMKNIVMASTHHPKYVVILFRDTMLTVPYFRTTGRYLELLDDYATDNEPVLTEIAFVSQMNPVEKFAEQYLPLYGMRWEIRARLDRRLRYTVPSLVGCPKECADGSMLSIFGRELDMTALNQMLDDSVDSLYTPDEMDFDRHINKSFLPALMELAQKNDVTLVFVRTGTLNYPSSETEPLALKKYIKALNSYLTSYDNVYFLDFAHDPRIDFSFFVDSVHFNAHGKELFTPILANELQALFKK